MKVRNSFRLVLTGFGLMLFGFLLLLFMVIRIIGPSIGLSFLAYAACLIGLILGTLSVIRSRR